MFIYFERVRELVCTRASTTGGGPERRRERIPSRLCTVSTEPAVELDLTDCKIMT